MKSTPIVSMSQAEGVVSVTRHCSQYLYEPLAQELASNRGKGTISVLTQTNEEALIITALLRKKGLNSRLIQSMDSFRFWNIAEVRLFLKHLELNTTTPLIPDEVWAAAKNKTFAAYATSESLHYLQRCIALFEQTNKQKYLTDFKEFVYESSVEDFCDLTGADVIVSTIHKSKGHEFDDVYLLVNTPRILSDEEKRKFYVAVTRAKKRLFIHTNGNIFDSLPADHHLADSHLYPMPNEVVLQLSHKDVNLGFFKSHKADILALRAGNPLRLEGDTLYSTPAGTAVAQLSQKMKNELCAWAEKGYFVTSSTARFIVAWKPTDAPKSEPEHAILLATLVLKNTSQSL